MTTSCSQDLDPVSSSLRATSLSLCRRTLQLLSSSYRLTTLKMPTLRITQNIWHVWSLCFLIIACFGELICALAFVSIAQYFYQFAYGHRPSWYSKPLAHTFRVTPDSIEEADLTVTSAKMLYTFSMAFLVLASMSALLCVKLIVVRAWALKRPRAEQRRHRRRDVEAGRLGMQQMSLSVAGDHGGGESL